MGRVDLHTHTCYSDGSLGPESLVLLAKKRGLEAIAITDHDVISGVRQAVMHGRKQGVEVIPGIEFSARIDYKDASIHLLGYFIDTRNKGLARFSKDVEVKKTEVIKKRIRLINKHLDSDVTFSEVKAKTRGVPVFPHISLVLYEKGLVGSIEEGNKYFFKGGPGYVERKDKIHAKKAVRMIHDAGGVAVLAHAFVYDDLKKRKDLESVLTELKKYGLDGVEIITPDATKRDVAYGMKAAKRYGLIITGGSDFHDEMFLPNNRLGGLDVGYSCVDGMRRLKDRKYLNKR